MIVSLLLAYLTFRSKIGLSLRKIVQLLQLNLSRSDDLETLLSRLFKKCQMRISAVGEERVIRIKIAELAQEKFRIDVLEPLANL